MNSKSENNAPSLPADEQGISEQADYGDADLSSQLFRYAEDLQLMIDRNDELTANYETLLKSSNQLMKSRMALNNLILNSKDIHLKTDFDGLVMEANRAAEVIANKRHILHSNLKDWILPSHLSQFEVILNAAKQMKPGTSNNLETELNLRCEYNKSATLVVYVQVLAVYDEQSTVLHWVIRDLTALREHELDNHLSLLILDSSSEGVMITDEKGNIKSVNRAFTRISGYSTEEAIGRNPRFLQSGMHDKQFYDSLWKSISETGKWQGMVYNRAKNGRNYAQWLCINAGKNHEGIIVSYIAVFTELSSLQKSNNDLTYLAYYDSLTGLPNRQLLHDRIGQVLSQARRTGVYFTLIFIDLDCFKQINDQHGHQIGDQVLQEAAQRMTDSVREIDTVSRPGGDEFILLFPGLYRETGIEEVCSKLIETIRQPILIAGKQYQVGASLGCAIYPEHGDNEIALIKHADIAMYEAKKTGSNNFVIYDPDFFKPMI